MAASLQRRQPLLPFTGGCRWCGGKVQPPRRTFCGAPCVHEYRLRSSNRYMRDCVFRRDGGVCGICGVMQTPMQTPMQTALQTALQTPMQIPSF